MSIFTVGIFYVSKHSFLCNLSANDNSKVIPIAKQPPGYKVKCPRGL